MYALFRKEINSFLNSLIGYISIAVFLIAIGLFLWIFPGNDLNIAESGYASIDGLFNITPWVYMFLIPAITMRMFSEEKRTGTIELLLTRPLTEFQIVFAKYLSGLILVLISLLPTLIYAFTVYEYAAPIGNVDIGGMAGSYLGLFFLAAGFVAIGVFSSATTDNQLVAFIVAMFLCMICYTGFQSLAGIMPVGAFANVVYQLGISAHYDSMSRGVIDTRDVIYFLSVISIFLMMTKLTLESRKW